LRAKRVVDLVFASVILLALLPVLLLIAALIRLESRGPVLYRQPRNGRDMQVFMILKFRTMRPEADASRQAQRCDERVTRVGRVLRRTSLDELPQLFNVLRGEMSLVGPRPHPLWLDERFGPEIPNYTRRFAVTPGITGLAQVNGCRGETPDVASMARRIEWDAQYVERASLSLDIKILLRTAAVIWNDRGAY
jgi:putative colanic acid biosynthesis UDP-glucose lipid carrier transferase